jgi:superfamily I DNA/RNA helicase
MDYIRIEGQSLCKCQSRVHGVHIEIDFNKTGVQIVSLGTMKGLEFDAVILPALR